MDAASLSDSPAQLVLETRCTGDEAERLHERLTALRGAALDIDATSVVLLATPCLQVLLAAARSWRQDSQTLRVKPSPDLVAGLRHVGLDVGALQSPEGAA